MLEITVKGITYTYELFFTAHGMNILVNDDKGRLMYQPLIIEKMSQLSTVLEELILEQIELLGEEE